LSGMDITEVDGKSDMMSFPSVTEITPAFAAGSDVSDGKGHSGVVVDGADAAPTVAWPTAPRQSEDDAEDAARAARLTATVATRTAKAPGVQMDLFGSRP